MSNVIRLRDFHSQMDLGDISSNSWVTIQIDSTLDFEQISFLIKSLNPKQVCLNFEPYEYSLSRRNMIDIMSLLANHPNMVALSFAKCRMSDKGIAILSNTLKINTTLVYLDLSDNTITDKKATLLASAFKKNTTLKILSLANNYTMTDNALVTLLDPFTGSNRTLTDLNLKGITHLWGSPLFYPYMSTDWVETLATILTNNPTLSRINIDGNNTNVTLLGKAIESIEDRFIDISLLFPDSPINKMVPKPQDSNITPGFTIKTESHCQIERLQKAFSKQALFMQQRLPLVSQALDPYLPKPIQGILWNYLNNSPTQIQEIFQEKTSEKKPKPSLLYFNQ